MRRTILLASGLVILIAVGALVFLKTSAGGFSARADPTFPEIFAAQTARSLAMPSDARARANPVAKTPEALEEAMEHWADHCAVCHGNDGAGQVPMGKQMYPHAPDMRQETTQKLTDGELFYIIENGIRLSGMPGGAARRPASRPRGNWFTLSATCLICRPRKLREWENSIRSLLKRYSKSWRKNNF